MKISVLGLKGGVGKTTIAVHLSAWLAEQGKVLLIDGDAHKSALSWVNSGTFDFECLDVADDGIKKAVKVADHVIVDTQGGAPTKDLSTLARDSDLCILPTFPDTLSLRVLVQTIKLVKETGNYRVLINRSPPRNQTEGDDALVYLHTHSIPVFNRAIRGAKAFQKAALQSSVVRDLKGDRNAGNCWRDICFLGMEILDDK